MNEVNLVFEGCKFMVLGMSVVFAFLFFLVQIISLQKVILDWLFGPELIEAANGNEIGNKIEDEAEIVAAIIGALQIHRKKDRKHE